MAYLAKQINEDEQNKFGLNQPSTPNPLPQAGGSAGASPSGGGSKAAPGFPSSTQFGSNAAKLSDYLSANKDQVDAYGNKIAGDLTNTYNQTLGDIDKGVNNFNTQVGQGYAQNNPDFIGQAASDPTNFVKNQDNVSKFQSLFNDQYTGPQNFESSDAYSGINDQVNKAVGNASLLNTPSGINTYLNNNSKENLTPGMQTLNSSLLQKSPEASQAIKAAATPYSGLTDYLSGKTQGANVGVANAKSDADSIRQGVQNQFIGPNGVLPTFQQGLQNNLTQARTQATDRNKAAIDSLTQGQYGIGGGAKKVSQQVSGDLGIDPVDVSLMNYLRSAGFDPLSYLQTGNPESQINMNNNSTTDDYAKSAALAQLTGQPGFLDQSNASQAGTANLDLSDFNVNDAMKNAVDLGHTSQAADPTQQEGAYQNLLAYLNGTSGPNTGTLDPKIIDTLLTSGDPKKKTPTNLMRAQ